MESTTTRVIAERGRFRLLPVGEDKAVVVDENGKHISPRPMPIASFLSRGYWRRPSEEGDVPALVRWLE